MRVQLVQKAIVGLMVIALAACQTTGEGGSFGGSGGGGSYAKTAAELQLEKDNEIFNETIFGGAAEGAVKGALIGALIGLATGNLRNAAIGAGAGAVGGGIVGGLDGYMVAKKQEAARRNVREIMIVAEDIEKENDLLNKSIANMDVVIDQTVRKLETTQAEFKAGTATLADLRQAEARAKNNVALAEKTLKGLESRNKELGEAVKRAKKQGDAKTVKKLQADLKVARAELDKQYKNLEDVKSMMRGGTVSG